MKRRNICFIVWQDILMQIRNYKWFTGENSGAAAGMMIYVGYLVFWLWNIFRKKQVDVFTVLFLLLLIIMIFTVLLGKICPINLPKIIYLCPMEMEERKKYLVTAYVSKVVLSFGVSSISMAIPIGMGNMSIGYGVTVVFATVMLAMGMNMAGAERTFQPSNKRDLELKRQCPGYFGWMMVQQMYSMVYFICVLAGATGAADMEAANILEFWLIIIASGINLLLTLLVLSFFPKTIKAVMNYEVICEPSETGKVKT